MKSFFSTLQFIFNHPLARKRKIASAWRYIKWQIQVRLFPFAVQYPFVEGTHLLIRRGMTGATGNIYTGLHEFDDMGYVLHLLRPGDVFGDIGANVGSYTILASGVAKAFTISIEPIHSTFLHLKHNVALNDLEDLVELHNCGSGEEPGTLYFSSNYDTVNHVLTQKESGAVEKESVEIKTPDQVFMNKTPVLIKMDVEGFEMSVLKGAVQLLKQPELKSLIIELNGSCRNYGVSEMEIHEFLLLYNFKPMSYSPLSRELRNLPSFSNNGNTIYVRDEQWVKSRISSARKVIVNGYAV